jgi:hypothetical protein
MFLNEHQIITDNSSTTLGENKLECMCLVFWYYSLQLLNQHLFYSILSMQLCFPYLDRPISIYYDSHVLLDTLNLHDSLRIAAEYLIEI